MEHLSSGASFPPAPEDQSHRRRTFPLQNDAQQRPGALERLGEVVVVVDGQQVAVAGVRVADGERDVLQEVKPLHQLVQLVEPPHLVPLYTVAPELGVKLPSEGSRGADRYQHGKDSRSIANDCHIMPFIQFCDQ